MAPVLFSHEVTIDGATYRARRLDGGGRHAASFVPLVGESVAPTRLPPLNITTWDHGRGWGKNADPRQSGLLLPGPLVTTVALPSQPGGDIEQFAEQDGHIYAVGGRYAYRIPNGSAAPVQDQDLGAAFLAVSVVPFKTSLFVGGRSTGNIWEKPSGGSWTNTMAGGAVQRGKMATVFWNTGGLASERLVAEQTTTSFSYVAANPRLDTDWTPNPTPTSIGSFPIRSVIASRDHVFFATTGGLRDVDSSGVAPNLTTQVAAMVFDWNGHATAYLNGWIYLGVAYDVLRLRVIGTSYAQPQWCGFGQTLPKNCQAAGYFYSFARWGDWLIAAQFDEATYTTWISWGREAIGDERGPLTWMVSPIVLTGLKVTAMHVSGLVSGEPRLWMATVTAGGTRSLAWAPLEIDTPYRDQRAGRPYRFATSFQWDDPETDHGDDSLPKLLPEEVLESENLGAGASVALAIAKDGATTYDTIGTITTSPRAVLKPTTSVRGNRWTTRMTGSGTTTVPPVIRKRSERPVPRPDVREVRGYQFVLGHAVRHAGGNLDGRDPEQVKAALVRLQTADPVTMTDEFGRALIVLIRADETVAEMEASLGDKHEQRVIAVNGNIEILSKVGASMTVDVTGGVDNETWRVD